MTRYARTGKQVFQDGLHMADATDEAAAASIVNALCAMEERSDAGRCEVQETLIIDAALIYGRKPIKYCIVRRETDEYACSCGLRWSVDEDDPH